MVIDLSMSGSQADLADLVGVTQPAISQLMTAGKIPPSGTLGELVHAYVRHMQQQANIRQSSGLLDLVQERAALAREQRLGIAYKNTVLRGEYAPAPLLTRVLGIVSEAVAVRFDELERSLFVQLPDLPNSAGDVVLQVIASARAEWLHGTAQLKSEPADDEENTLDMESDL